MELEEEWEEATEVFEQPRSYVLVRCPVVGLSRVQGVQAVMLRSCE